MVRLVALALVILAIPPIWIVRVLGPFVADTLWCAVVTVYAVLSWLLICGLSLLAFRRREVYL